jgi:CRISPR-associated endoribonuclease Cas6
MSSFSLITGTPIIIRIPKERYEEFGSKLNIQYDEIFWRSDHPIELFIRQLEIGLAKKYSEYTSLAGQGFFQSRFGLNNSSPTFIQKFRLKKQVATRIQMKGSSHVVIGTLWEFRFGKSACDQKLVQFALDSGFGERNSLGFGFMNLIK